MSAIAGRAARWRRRASGSASAPGSAASAALTSSASAASSATFTTPAAAAAAAAAALAQAMRAPAGVGVVVVVRHADELLEVGVLEHGADGARLGEQLDDHGSDAVRVVLLSGGKRVELILRAVAMLLGRLTDDPLRQRLLGRERARQVRCVVLHRVGYACRELRRSGIIGKRRNDELGEVRVVHRVLTRQAGVDRAHRFEHHPRSLAVVVGVEGRQLLAVSLEP